MELCPGRSALTLVELLVAMAVLSLLAAIALPATKGVIDEQRIGRAANTVAAAFEVARGRAIANGGGGLLIERRGDRSMTGRCEADTLRYFESTPDYTPEAGAELPYLAFDSTSTSANDYVLYFPPEAGFMRRSALDNESGDLPSLVNVGDEIEIGDAGISGIVTDLQNLQATGPENTDRDNDFDNDVPFPLQSAGAILNRTRLSLSLREVNRRLHRSIGRQVTFRVRRRPRPSILPPIQVPGGMALDLTASGIGLTGRQFSPMDIGYSDSTLTVPVQSNYVDPNLPPFATQTGNTSGRMDYGSVLVFFDGRGAVSRVRSAVELTEVTTQNGLTAQFPVYEDLPVTGDLYFLLGEAGSVKTDPTEQLEDHDSDFAEDRADDGTTPLLNPRSVWVIVRALTGRPSTSPWLNPAGDALVPAAPTAPTNTTRQQRLARVLQITRAASDRSTANGI